MVLAISLSFFSSYAVNAASFVNIIPPVPFLLLAHSSGGVSGGKGASNETGDNGTGSGVDVDITYHHARHIRTQDGHDAAVPLYRQLLLSHKDKEQHQMDADERTSFQNYLQVGDITAATRIAASFSSPHRQDRTCPVSINISDNQKDKKENDEKENVLENIETLRSILRQSNFDNLHIPKIFGIEHIDRNEFYKPESKFTKAQSLSFARGPVYLTPISAGSQTNLPSFLREEMEHIIISKQGNGNAGRSSEAGSKENADILNVSSMSSLKCLVALFLLGFAGM